MSRRKKEYHLYLYNDNENGVEYVEHVLKTTLAWDTTQAINCSSITHHTGKCLLKTFDNEEEAMYINKVFESKNLITRVISHD